MKYSKSFLAILFILVFGAFLRFVNISQYPMYGDELTLAYDAYSIFKTGSDQTGQFLPFTFKMAGGHPPAFVYFSIPFIALFGPTEIGIRFLSVISGIGLILLAYLLGKKLINEKAGLFAAFLMGISPWDIHLSRIGFETHFALFLTTLGVYFFLVAKEKSFYLIWSALSFSVAVHTYSTYKLTIPLILLLLIWFVGVKKDWFSKQKLKYSVGSLLILSITGLILIVQAFLSNAETRFLQINIFNQTEIRNQIGQKVISDRELVNLSPNLSQLFHNKVLEYKYLLKSNYLEHFSTDFLFLKGDSNPRHNGAELGEMYIVEALFLGLGLVFLFKTNIRVFKFLVLWLLIGPVPTALISGPHALRSSLMIFPLILLSGIGFYYLWTNANSYKLIWLRGVILTILLVEFLIFGERHYFLSANKFGNFFAENAKEVAGIIRQEKGKYDFILVSDKIDAVELAYPVYARLEPQEVISQNLKRTDLEGLSFKKYGNVYIGYIPLGDLERFASKIGGKVVYLGSEADRNYLVNYEIKNTSNHSPGFLIKRF